MDFGLAIRALKQGRTVARAGWNGKGMWLALSPGNPALEAGKFWAGPNRDYAEQNGGAAPVLPCITMKTATGEILMGWLASQTDMLAEDWEIVGPPPAGINTDPQPYWQNEEPEPTREEVVSEAAAKLVEIAGNGTAWPEKPTDVLERVCVSRLTKLGIPVPSDLRQICNDALMRALMKG